ncbi:MAG TPA: hypothetical protein VFQ61_17730 [Polyangiaceae bacterium]|nr:hypothetical protein [Polyangiaceae bacterium]
MAANASRVFGEDLPDSDPSMLALAPDARIAVARVWLSRSQNEHKTSFLFEHVLNAATALEADGPVLTLARRAIGDELRHAELCRRVAERYARSENPKAAEMSPIPQPRFRGCSERESALLCLVMHCCVNETIASAYLKHCLDAARGNVARVALRCLLRDEVDHSRLGWAHLASSRVDESERRTVGDAMPELLHAVRAAWLASDDDLSEAAPEGHGSLPIRDVAAAVLAAVNDLIIPGLAHVGVDPSRARSWLSRQPLA